MRNVFRSMSADPIGCCGRHVFGSRLCMQHGRRVSSYAGLWAVGGMLLISWMTGSAMSAPNRRRADARNASGTASSAGQGHGLQAPQRRGTAVRQRRMNTRGGQSMPIFRMNVLGPSPARRAAARAACLQACKWHFAAAAPFKTTPFPSADPAGVQDGAPISTKSSRPVRATGGLARRTTHRRSAPAQGFSSRVAGGARPAKPLQQLFMTSSQRVVGTARPRAVQAAGGCALPPHAAACPAQSLTAVT